MRSVIGSALIVLATNQTAPAAPLAIGFVRAFGQIDCCDPQFATPTTRVIARSESSVFAGPGNFQRDIESQTGNLSAPPVDTEAALNGIVAGGNGGADASPPACIGCNAFDMRAWLSSSVFFPSGEVLGHALNVEQRAVIVTKANPADNRNLSISDIVVTIEMFSLNGWGGDATLDFSVYRNNPGLETLIDLHLATPSVSGAPLISELSLFPGVSGRVTEETFDANTRTYTGRMNFIIPGITTPQATYAFVLSTQADVPEPGTLLLFGTGLGALAARLRPKAEKTRNMPRNLQGGTPKGRSFAATCRNGKRT